MMFATAAYAGDASSSKFTVGGKMLLNNVKNAKTEASLQNNEILSLTLKVEGENLKSKLEAVGCKVKTHTKTVYFVTVSADKIDALAALPEVKTIDRTGKSKLSMNASKKAINAETVTANGLTENNIIAGEGVLVGVVDTGIDLFHPDFSDENGTRVLYFWDMSHEDATKRPEGYDWGTEYTKEYIDANLQNLVVTDAVGHGSHVAGTIAGGGKGDEQYRGIAYNSDILFVKGMRSDDSKNLPNEDIIAGCQYLVDKAKELGKPIAINLSLGALFEGGHDGTDLLSQAINELSGPGVIFSIAAGNEGEYPVHAGTEMTAGKNILMPIYPTNLREAGLIELPDESYENNPDFYITGGDVWYDAGVTDSLTVSLYDMYSLMFGSTTPMASYTFALNDEDIADTPLTNANGATVGYIGVMQTPDDPNSHDGNARFYVHNGANRSIQFANTIIGVTATGKGDGYIDMWAGVALSKEEIPVDISLPNTEIIWGDGLQTVATPALADSAISVGSFITKLQWTTASGQKIDYSRNYTLGDISSFSSRGPSRDRRILPVISAPGQTVFSVRSSTMNYETLSSLSENILSDENYIGMDGTSMATPHVTGALALMLQINPELSAKEAAEILRATATTDEFTGETPNNVAGSGKIDVQKAINYMLGASAKDYVMANDVKVYPMPANAEIYVDLDAISFSNSGDLFVVNSIGARQDVPFELTGGKLKMNISSLASGIYAGEYRMGETVSKFKFVKK